MSAQRKYSLKPSGSRYEWNNGRYAILDLPLAAYGVCCRAAHLFVHLRMNAGPSHQVAAFCVFCKCCRFFVFAWIVGSINDRGGSVGDSSMLFLFGVGKRLCERAIG